VKGLELDLHVDDLQVDICGRTLSHTSTVFVQFRVLHRYSSRSAPTWPASSVSIISTLLERVTQYYSGYLNVSVNNLLPYLVLQKTPLNRDSNSESACCRTFWWHSIVATWHAALALLSHGTHWRRSHRIRHGRLCRKSTK